MIRLLLVDDHAMVRAGTRALLLRDAPDIAVVGETGRGEEALALAMELRPDVAALDIGLPDISGVEVARRLRERAPGTKVLVVTGHPEGQYVRALFAIGVHGYLLKDDPAAELIAAIRGVHAGREVVSAAVAAHLMTKKRRAGHARDELTAREREVLAHVRRGRATGTSAAAWTCRRARWGRTWRASWPSSAPTRAPRPCTRPSAAASSPRSGRRASVGAWNAIAPWRASTCAVIRLIAPTPPASPRIPRPTALAWIIHHSPARLFRVHAHLAPTSLKGRPPARPYG